MARPLPYNSCRRPVGLGFKGVPSTRKRKRQKITRKEVTRIAKNAILSVSDSKLRTDTQTLAAKYTFNSFLLYSTVAQGNGDAQRVGNELMATSVSVKYLLQHAQTTPTTAVAPIELRMFLVKVNKSESPGTYWFSRNNSDTNDPYLNPQGNTTAANPAGDKQRGLSRINVKEISILKKKFITVHPAYTENTNECAYRYGTFSFKWKLPKKILYTQSLPPYTPQAMSQRYYIITYFHQPSETLDNVANANLDIYINQYYKDV